jgi:hypothetical protein
LSIIPQIRTIDNVFSFTEHNRAAEYFSSCGRIIRNGKSLIREVDIMQDRKKQDSLFVNNIANPDEITAVSKTPAGNAGKDPFCVYAHKRHAAGSRIENRNGGPGSVCQDDGIWHSQR